MFKMADMKQIKYAMTENEAVCFHARKFTLAGAGVMGNVARPFL